MHYKVEPAPEGVLVSVTDARGGTTTVPLDAADVIESVSTIRDALRDLRPYAKARAITSKGETLEGEAAEGAWASMEFGCLAAYALAAVELELAVG